MRSIAVANQKGGVGKTTTSVNLAVALSRAGRHVCLIDLDPQAHATLHVGVTPGADGPTAFDVLTADQPLAAACVSVSETLSVVPAHIDLSAVELALAGKSGRESILRSRMAADPRFQSAPGLGGLVGQSFDYVIVDCPPSLGLLSLNAMAAVGEVLLPLQPHFLALHGLSKLLETIEFVSDRVNPRLRLLGVVLCMHEAATRLAGEIGRDVEAFFAGGGDAHPAWGCGKLFGTKIRRNIRLAEAPSFGQSIFDYAPESNGAEDYAALAAEVDQAAAVERDGVRRVA
ncbi:MAG: ParA family protein [Planctomycetia bacterium]|nr:ParA family protein [Planctomycetia bacterium]